MKKQLSLPPPPQETLRNSEEQYRATLDAMADTMLVVDSRLRIVLFNKAFLQFNKKFKLKKKVMGCL